MSNLKFLDSLTDDTQKEAFLSLKEKVQYGALSDWEKRHHAVSMCCKAFLLEHAWLRKWPDELVELLEAKHVVLEGKQR